MDASSNDGSERVQLLDYGYMDSGSRSFVGIKQGRFPRLVTRDGHFNLKQKNLSIFGGFSSTYHQLLNMRWWILLFFSLAYFAIANAIFAGLYMIDLDGIGNATNFGDAMFFSVQTMNTIGYGYFYPKSVYVNILVCFQTWLGLLAHGCLAALIFAKAARPSRLRHSIVFSDVAVINKEEFSHKKIRADLNTIEETYGKGVPCLAFRMVNIRKRQATMSQFRLLFLRKVPPTLTQFSGPIKNGVHEMNMNNSGYSSSGDFTITEMNYEINHQMGRARGVAWTEPLLPLPWLVVHPIDSRSPLYGLTPRDLIDQHAEIIAVFEGVDELTSHNFQTRWSYVPEELRWGCIFVPMVDRDKRGEFVVDYEKLSVIDRDFHRKPTGADIISM